MNNLKHISKSKFLVLLILLFGINQANAQLLCTDSCSVAGPELVINGDFALQIQNSSYTTSAPFQIPIWARRYRSINVLPWRRIAMRLYDIFSKN